MGRQADDLATVLAPSVDGPRFHIHGARSDAKRGWIGTYVATDEAEDVAPDEVLAGLTNDVVELLLLDLQGTNIMLLDEPEEVQAPLPVPEPFVLQPSAPAPALFETPEAPTLVGPWVAQVSVTAAPVVRRAPTSRTRCRFARWLSRYLPTLSAMIASDCVYPRAVGLAA